MVPVAMAVSLPSISRLRRLRSAVRHFALLEEACDRSNLAPRRASRKRGWLGGGLGLAGTVPDAPPGPTVFPQLLGSGISPLMARSCGDCALAVSREHRAALRVSSWSGPRASVAYARDFRLLRTWRFPVRMQAKRAATALLVLPALLTLGAASIRRYPYGVSARVNLYLVSAAMPRFSYRPWALRGSARWPRG